MTLRVSVSWLASTGLARNLGPYSKVLLAFLTTSFGVALVSSNTDALFAWERVRQLHFGLLLPTLCLLLTPSMQNVTDGLHPDAWRVRRGENRRTIVLLRLGQTIALAIGAHLVALVVGRLLACPAYAPCVNRDFAIDLAIGAVTTTAYIPFFGALGRVGLGVWGSYLGFAINLTLGYSTDFWSHLTPHRLVAEMLDGHGILLGLPHLPGASLLGLACVSALWILTQTRR